MPGCESYASFNKDAINKAVSTCMMRGEYPEYRAARIHGFSVLQMVV